MIVCDSVVPVSHNLIRQILSVLLGGMVMLIVVLNPLPSFPPSQTDSGH